MTRRRSPEGPFGEGETAPAFARGLEAYACGDFLTAHEHFEHAWRGSGTPRSVELHALAQLAAALFKHAAQRRPTPARAIARRALEKLRRLPGSAHGIDLEALGSELDAWIHDETAPPPRLQASDEG